MDKNLTRPIQKNKVGQNLKQFKMKKLNLLLIIIGLIFSVQSFSQVSLGLKAGGNLSDMKYDINSDYGEDPVTKAKMGFHVGLISDITILKNTLSLQPAILYSTKGFAYDLEDLFDEMFNWVGVDMENYEGYARYNYNYLEVPVNLVFQMKGFQFSAGPYAAVGLGGSFTPDFTFEVEGDEYPSDEIFDKDSYKLKPVFGTVDNEMFSEFIEDEDVMDLFRALDYGINAGLGYRFMNVQINLGASLGLGNLTPSFDADEYGLDSDFAKNVIQKNRLLTLSVAYFFN